MAEPQAGCLTHVEPQLVELEDGCPWCHLNSVHLSQSWEPRWCCTHSLQPPPSPAHLPLACLSLNILINPFLREKKVQIWEERPTTGAFPKGINSLGQQGPLMTLVGTPSHLPSSPAWRILQQPSRAREMLTNQRHALGPAFHFCLQSRFFLLSTPLFQATVHGGVGRGVGGGWHRQGVEA